MKGFIKVVDWYKFNKTIGIISIVLIINQLLNNKIDWLVMAIIPLITLLLLLRAYSDYMIKIKPNLPPPTIKEIRLKKLKKLNRWKFLRI